MQRQIRLRICGDFHAVKNSSGRPFPIGQTCGGDEQNRTVDPLLARQVLSQLSYTPMGSLLKDSLVGSSGLEPPTSRLSGVRSNHLSYEPVL